MFGLYYSDIEPMIYHLKTDDVVVPTQAIKLITSCDSNRLQGIHTIRQNDNSFFLIEAIVLPQYIPFSEINTIINLPNLSMKDFPLTHFHQLL